MAYHFLEILFWFSFPLIVYIYAGYPFFLFLANKFLKPIKFKADIEKHFSVTIFIPVYNEADIIRKKIENTIQLNYPNELLEIVIASDGSTDGTIDILRSYENYGIRVFKNKINKGKNFLINKFIPLTKGDIIVFTDANSMLSKEAINNLVKHFSDSRVGCVGGRLKYMIGESSVSKGEGLYFQYENIIRKLEGLRGCMVGANGAIYAIRRNLFVPVPSYVPNDFYHPLTILKRGFLSLFDESAIAREKPTETVEEEFNRRARIVARSVGAVWEAGRLFGWFKGKGRFNLLSHKILRWFAFTILVAMLLFNALLLNQPFYKWIFGLQITFYALGILGYTFDKLGIKFRIFFVPYYFLLINIAGIVGMLNFFRGQRVATWKSASTTR